MDDLRAEFPSLTLFFGPEIHAGPRIDLAKEVARLAIQRLQPHDKVGIVEFYGAKRWAARIQSAANRIDIASASMPYDPVFSEMRL